MISSTVERLVHALSFNPPRAANSSRNACISTFYRDIGAFGVLNERVFRRKLWGI
jgi:hypothetical protein